MKSHHIIYILMTCMLIGLISCEKEIRDSGLSADASTCKEVGGYVEGEANILFSEETTQLIEEGKLTPDSLGLNSLVRLFPYSEKYEGRKRREGLHRWYKVSFDSGLETKSGSRLQDIEGVEKVIPARVGRTAAFFNDPKAIYQWHYYNDGSISSEFMAGADINVETVWQDYTTGNKSVIVAVVDQGIDYNHEDLAAHYVDGHNFVTNGKVTADDHGTHVAGTIAAVNNNGIGVSGIAGGNALEGIQGVGILSCQIFSGSKSTQHSPEAIVWAADHGAVIANNSWGYVFENSETSKKAVIDDDLKTAIDYFIKYAGCDDNGNQLPDSPMKGGVVIFAAGNDSWDSNPICAYEPVISVGSIGPDYSRAYYSNYGDWVDIAAPGGTAKISSAQVLSTLASGKYGEMQGTSMACPHVSGIAALIVSYYGGQGFTNDMLKERLLGGARKDILPLAAKVGPLADALGSMTYGGTTAPEKVKDYDVASIGNKVTITLEVAEDKDDVKVYEYLVLMSTSAENMKTVVPETLPEGMILNRFRTGRVPVGNAMDLTIRDLEFETEYFICVAGRDYAGNISEWSEVRSIRTEKNNPPVISPTVEMGDIILRSHQSANIPLAIYDPEGNDLYVSISEGLSGASIKRADNSIWNLIITASIANPGKYSGEIISTDVEGLTATFPIRYEILANSAPIKVKEIGNLLSLEKGRKYEYDLKEYFSDPDGENLTYKVIEGNRMVAKATLEGERIVIESSGFGSTSVTVSASDGRKATTEMKINIVVKNEDNILEIFPVPVETILYIRTGDLKSTDITIKTINGQVVYDVKGMNVSAFEPAAIDMSAYAPGKYKIRVTIDGQTYERIITKI